MIYLFFILIGTIVVSVIGLNLVIKNYFNRWANLQEIAIVVAGISIISISGYFISISNEAKDYEILSGKVTQKKKEIVNCRHSYPCNCHEECSGSGSNRSCYEYCETCYEHAYDVDWNIYSSIGEFTIDTIDSQGLKQPLRWTEVKEDDSVSRIHSYDNWLKATPDTIYRRNTNKEVPKYPLRIYDYYKIDRVVDDGVKIPIEDLRSLNIKISLSLRDIAPEKQVNYVMVLTNKKEEFATDIKNAWLGGKKNDLIMVLGISEYPKIDWVEVFGWSKNDIVNVSTRDDIKDHAIVDEGIIDIANSDVQKYWLRDSMSNYEYLKKEVVPSVFAVVVIFLISLLFLTGLLIFFIKNRI